MKDVIKSVSDSQEEIITWIMKLYCPEGIELDPTYSKGKFYNGIKKPKYKYDIIPQYEHVTQSDCCDLPHEDSTIQSIMFDPPFVGVGKGMKKTGIISKRFHAYPYIPDLWEMYRNALNEFHRILKPNGVLVFKNQDCIESSKQYLTHVEIINYAYSIGLYPKDLFILTVKNRIMSEHQWKQQHARKFHSYFLVFIKEEPKVKYSNVARQEPIKKTVEMIDKVNVFVKEPTTPLSFES